MAKAFTEAEIDFEGLSRELSGLAPPKVTMEEVLGRLRKTMLEQKAKGVTVEQMREVLQGRGINVGVRKLRSFLERGEMGPGGRPAGISPARIEKSESGTDF